MRKKLLVLGIVFLLIFTIFSWSIKREAFRNIDFAFTVKLQEALDKSPRLRFSRLAGEVMEGFTFFASPEVSVVAVLGITGLTLYDWKRKRVRWNALFIPLFFFFLVMGEVYGKSVVHHPAPPFFMIKNPTTMFPKYYINEQFSYPSGHAARAVFLAIIFLYITLRTSFFKKKNIRIGIVFVLTAYIGLVSISRIYLGHHWLSDIVGGWLLGGGMIFLVLALLNLRTDG